MHESTPLTNLLAERARELPDQICVRQVGGEDRTFAQMWERVRHWAALVESLGVEPGDRVLTMSPASILALELWLGSAAAHAIEVPVNTQYVGNLLTHVFKDSESALLLCSERYLDAVSTADLASTSLTTIVVVDADHVEVDIPGCRVLAAGPLLDSLAPLAEVVPSNPWDISTIIYTSGTTGPAKGVLVPWAQLHETMMGCAPARTLRKPECVFYAPYPPFHVTGKGPFYSTVMGGGVTVLRERFDTNSFWDDIEAFKCTFTLLVGALAGFLYHQPESPNDASNSLEAVLFSPWIAEVEDFKRRFGVEAYSSFNMTEISSPIVAGWDDEPIVNPKSCGRGRPGFDLQLVDDLDFEVPVGTPGELIVRSSKPWTLMAGYWKNPEATVSAWRNQWFHTGDLFVQDEGGNFIYLDRKKDSIRRRGENISSADVEKEVTSHPAVLESAAVAIADPVNDEEIKVFVVKQPGSDLNELDLVEFLRGKLPRFMVPRFVEFVEELPKTPTQKVRKAELRSIGITDTTWDATDGQGSTVRPVGK